MLYALFTVIRELGRNSQSHLLMPLYEVNNPPIITRCIDSTQNRDERNRCTTHTFTSYILCDQASRAYLLKSLLLVANEGNQLVVMSRHWNVWLLFRSILGFGPYPDSC